MIARTMVNWFHVSQGFKYPKGWYRVMCPDGRRRYATATAIEPDTYFSHPAAIQVKINGEAFKVSGYVTSKEGPGEGGAEVDYEFRVIQGRKNSEIFTAEGKLIDF